MAYSAIFICFICFIVIVIIAMIFLVFYINGWFCFEKTPRILCFKNLYADLYNEKESSLDDEESVYEKRQSSDVNVKTVIDVPNNEAQKTSDANVGIHIFTQQIRGFTMSVFFGFLQIRNIITAIFVIVGSITQRVISADEEVKTMRNNNKEKRMDFTDVIEMPIDETENSDEPRSKQIPQTPKQTSNGKSSLATLILNFTEKIFSFFEEIIEVYDTEKSSKEDTVFQRFIKRIWSFTAAMLLFFEVLIENICSLTVLILSVIKSLPKEIQEFCNAVQLLIRMLIRDCHRFGVTLFSSEDEILDEARKMEMMKKEKTENEMNKLFIKKQYSESNKPDKETGSNIESKVVNEADYLENIQGQSDASDDENKGTKIDRFGTVCLTFGYDILNKTLSIRFQEVRRLPMKIYGGSSQYQLHAALYNEQNKKFHQWRSPQFDSNKDKIKPEETEFNFESKPVMLESIKEIAIRIRLYGCELKRRNILLSEIVMSLSEVNFDQLYTIRLEKKRELKHLKKNAIEMGELTKRRNEAKMKKHASKRQDEVDHGNVEKSSQETAMIRLGLSYNILDECLTIELDKGMDFKNPLKRGDKLPSTFVKVTVSSLSNRVLSTNQTTVQDKQEHPVFRERFKHRLSNFVLDEINIMVAVYHKKSMHQNLLIGWINLQSLDAIEDQKSHWAEMKNGFGEMSYRWHTLKNPSDSTRGVPGAE